MLTNGWEADIIDVETAFLYGNLEKEIFMKIPEGLDVFLDTKFQANDCFLLLQAMYGLVQAARQYYKKIIKTMVENLKFEKCLADTCLLKRLNNKGTIIISVYVDNILCIWNCKAIDCLKIELSNFFEVKDEGLMEEYVGCSVLTNETGNIVLH